MLAMNTQTNPFPGGVHRNQPKTASMNGKPYTQANMEMAHLSEEEQEIAMAEQELKAKREDIQRKRDLAEQETKTRLLQDRDKALAAAANFRKEARTAADDDKKALYEWATEADAEARAIEVSLGIAVATEDVPEAKAPTPSRRLMTILQVLGVLAAILFFHGQFEGLGETIKELNHGVAPENQLRPYDDTSIQKLFYEKLVVFVDLPLAVLVLMLVVPFVGFYVLPFVKSKKDFYTEFYEDLTPWQRACITTAFCLGVLLFLALSHNVKP